MRCDVSEGVGAKGLHELAGPLAGHEKVGTVVAQNLGDIGRVAV